MPSDQYFCFKWLHNSQMAGSDIMFPICVEIYCQNWTLRKTFIAQLTILIGQDSNLSYVVSQQPLKRLCHNKWPQQMATTNGHNNGPAAGPFPISFAKIERRKNSQISISSSPNKFN